MRRAACTGLVLVALAGCGGSPAAPPAGALPVPAAAPAPAAAPPRYVICCIADGWGYKQIEAAKAYSGRTPVYAAWTQTAMSTWDLDTQRSNGGAGYDPQAFWGSVTYGVAAAADSASTATTMFSGVKTDRGNIGMGPGDQQRTVGLHELAVRAGYGSGVVTSVQVSHATPGCWYAHNDYRRNGWAIADEGFFGDPLALGAAGTTGRDGSHGPTPETLTVLIGGGHPEWEKRPGYVSQATRDRLAMEHGTPGKWTFVERQRGAPDGGARLMQAAADPATKRLAGLFGGTGGNIEWRRPDGSGHNPENPTLRAMAQAALVVLGREHPRGFALLIEGGAVDWGGHANRLDLAVGEQLAFDEMLAAVVEWVEDERNGSSWANTLVLVTGDHECGFVTAGPGVHPDKPLGEVSARTFKLERLRKNGRRASWDDTNRNGRIDEGEPVFWAWHTGYHSNSLIPLYAKGRGSERLQAADLTAGTDPVRGRYVDNPAIFIALRDALLGE